MEQDTSGCRMSSLPNARRRGPPPRSPTKIIIFGTGSAGTQLAYRLSGPHDSRYQPVALLDDDPAKLHLRIAGIAVRGNRTQMAEVAADTGATMLVIAIAKAEGAVIQALTDLAAGCGLIAKVIPSVEELIRGDASVDAMRDPRIRDLLSRRRLETDTRAIYEQFAGKRILVTGAGGSIGSELCRQLHRLRPAALIMLDRDESALHAVQLLLHGRALLDSDEVVLADIRDGARVRQVFEQYRPEVVFHAAALKHLPLLELYPAEAVKSNVWGTLTVLEAALACGVTSFVNISTDKAADPVSVLGHSKRAAERLTAHAARRGTGTYLSVRFGNVLGSRGSVLPAFCAQVAAGGPVTVTHPKVRRYFMTTDEAVQLVLQAAVIGRDGEVLVLDMGEPVLIADIARRLVAGADREVSIVYTGLRPGEKLTECALGEDEPDVRPFHPLIRHVPVMPLDPALTAALDPQGRPDEIRAALAEVAKAGLGQPLAAAGGSR
jgi:FlaA1/EpsC-like NDP-sugar epimerase